MRLRPLYIVIACISMLLMSEDIFADSFEDQDGVSYFLSDKNSTAEAIGTFINEGTVKIKSVVQIEVPDPQNPNKKITKSYTVVAVSGFSNKNFSSVSIPSTVTEIKPMAFNSCGKLKSINLPAGLKTLGRSSFGGCESLTEVSIPAGCIVDDSAFASCISLKSASSTGVDSIGNSVFSGCISLEQGINLPSKSGKGIYYDCKSLKFKPITEHGIPQRTFYGCTALEVNEIRMLDGAEIGDGAFSGCTSIKEIYIEGAPIGDGAFDNCTSLKTVEFGESVSKIGSSAFNSCPLETIICNAYMPPIALDKYNASAFSPLHYSSATLYVPANWMSVYATTEPWKNFISIKSLGDLGSAEIIETSPVAVTSENGHIIISGVSGETIVTVYDTKGSDIMHATVNELSHISFQSGAYIVKCGKKAYKLLI